MVRRRVDANATTVGVVVYKPVAMFDVFGCQAVVRLGPLPGSI